MTKFVELRGKIYSYLINDGNEDKKEKGKKKCVIKKNLTLKAIRCLEATQLENKTNHLEKNYVDINSLKEFMKNNKSILKIHRKGLNVKSTMFSATKLTRLL